MGLPAGEKRFRFSRLAECDRQTAGRTTQDSKDRAMKSVALVTRNSAVADKPRDAFRG